MSVANSNLPPVTEGYYVATNLDSRLQIGYDRFAIRKTDDGLAIASKHTMFGPTNLVQASHFALDEDWAPRRLEVTVQEQEYSTVVEFGENETVMSIHTPAGDKELRFPVGRRRAYFLLNGGISFPLHIVRRFQFDRSGPQQFDVIPEGVSEVWRLRDGIEGEQIFRVLEMRIRVSSLEDRLRLVVNEYGDLVRYRTRNLNMLVNLEERKPSC